MICLAWCPAGANHGLKFDNFNSFLFVFWFIAMMTDAWPSFMALVQGSGIQVAGRPCIFRDLFVGPYVWQCWFNSIVGSSVH